MRLAAKNELCSGCRVCELACAMEVRRENNPKQRLLRIEAHFPAPGKYEIHYCTQCGECAAVCPVEAITQEDGVHHDESSASAAWRAWRLVRTTS